MRKKSCGCVCLLAIAICVFQPCLNAVCAPEARGGEAIAMGGDAGEPVSDSGRGGGSGAWKWLVGVGAVVVAGLGGYALADDSKSNKDDAEAAAAEAAASAAAAEAAAAGAGAEEGLKTKVYITGTFTAAGTTTYNGGAAFTPSLTFAVETASYPGGVIDYVSSDGVTGATGLGGSYTQISEKSLRIQVNDGFYLGTVTKVNATTIKLHNETGTAYILNGGVGAHIWVTDAE